MNMEKGLKIGAGIAIISLIALFILIGCIFSNPSPSPAQEEAQVHTGQIQYIQQPSQEQVPPEQQYSHQYSYPQPEDHTVRNMAIATGAGALAGHLLTKQYQTRAVPPTQHVYVPTTPVTRPVSVPAPRPAPVYRQVTRPSAPSYRPTPSYRPSFSSRRR